MQLTCALFESSRGKPTPGVACMPRSISLAKYQELRSLLMAMEDLESLGDSSKNLFENVHRCSSSVLKEELQDFDRERRVAPPVPQSLESLKR